MAVQTPRFSEIAKSTNLHGRIKDATIPKIQNFNEFRNFRNDGRAICVSKVPCRNMTFRFGRHQPGRSNSENSEIVQISEFSKFTWPQHRRPDSENSEIQPILEFSECRWVATIELLSEGPGSRIHCVGGTGFRQLLIFGLGSGRAAFARGRRKTSSRCRAVV